MFKVTLKHFLELRLRSRSTWHQATFATELDPFQIHRHGHVIVLFALLHIILTCDRCSRHICTTKRSCKRILGRCGGLTGNSLLTLLTKEFC